MKIKNLLLLGLMAVCSMNVFAADYKSNGITYTITGTAPNLTATVKSISTGIADATTITIPASFTDGDGKTVKVTGFASTWATAENDVTSKTTSLTVNIDNFTSFPTGGPTGVFYALKKLATLELKGTSTIDADITVPAFSNNGGTTTIANLKYANLAPKAGKKLTFAAPFDVTALATVTLPTGTDIPANAFENAKNLTSVTGAKNIGKEAFKGAIALETLTMSGTTIGKKAFAGASKLATLTGLDAVTEVGDYAFTGTKITAANLAAATKIGEGAFKDVATITSITLKSTGDANSVEIGDDAFNGLKEVTTLTIPATVKYANTTSANGVFANMAKLATLTINNDVIPAAAFTADNAIATLTIKNPDLATIPANAFTSTKIVALDFSMCPSLTSVAGAFPANAFTKIKLSGSQVAISDFTLTGAAGSLKTLTLSAVETAIGANQFQSFTKLANVSLPASITSIGDDAFQGSALTAITIPEGCWYIGDRAFQLCKDLATVTFVSEDPLTAAWATIGDNAFEGTAIAKITIPAHVVSIGADAFLDCALLKRFQANSAYDETVPTWIGISTIPAAFDGCDKLSEVVIPKTVSVIADNAFKDHAKLATVTFKHEGADDDASVAMTYIGVSAFEGTAITDIDLSLTQLDDLDNDNVFKGCASLATITLPEEMNSLQGDNIFAGTAIETLDASMVNGWIGSWTGNLFGSDKKNPNTTLKVLKVGHATIVSDAFQYCSKLKTLITGAATIRSNAFGYCEKLATVTVEPYGSYVDPILGTIWKGATIAKGAFDHCSALTTFNYVPETVDPSEFGSVHGQAFTGCTPFVVFNTCKEFATWYENVDTKAPKGKGWGGAPINTTWTADIVSTIVKTVQDKANPNQFIGKFVSTYDASFDANDAKLYSIYMDGETAYYAACRVDDGRYYVNAGDHVVLKTDEAKEVSWNVESTASMGNSAVGFDDVANLFIDGELADIQLVLGLMPGQYVYRFTNTEDQGFGFTYYSGKTVKAGQFFVASEKKPEGAGRLNQVWLDEDGNVESDATAIQKIQNTTDAENGAIYNLQGVRVQKAQKGLYIQNGKKYVVK